MINVSVIMAVRNSEQFISQAIESVLNQTYKNFEFIIIDDFSNDSTYKIIKNFKKMMEELNYIEILLRKVRQHLEILQLV